MPKPESRNILSILFLVLETGCLPPFFCNRPCKVISIASLLNSSDKKSSSNSVRLKDIWFNKVFFASFISRPITGISHFFSLEICFILVV